VAESTPVAPKLTEMETQNPTATSLAVVEVGNTIEPPPSPRKTNTDCQPNERPDVLRPTHENTPHRIIFNYRAGDQHSPLRMYDLGNIITPVPVSAGREQCIQILLQLMSGLRKWLDPSNVELVLSLNHAAQTTSISSGMKTHGSFGLQW